MNVRQGNTKEPMNIKVTLLALLAMSSAAFALPLGIDFSDHTYAPIDGVRGQYSNGGITFMNAFPSDLLVPGQPAALFVYSSTLGVSIANGAAAQISSNTYSGAIMNMNPQGDLYIAFSKPEEMDLTISSWDLE
jgi:hypothetical protein